MRAGADARARAIRGPRSPTTHIHRAFDALVAVVFAAHGGVAERAGEMGAVFTDIRARRRPSTLIAHEARGDHRGRLVEQLARSAGGQRHGTDRHRRVGSADGLRVLALAQTDAAIGPIIEASVARPDVCPVQTPTRSRFAC